MRCPARRGASAALSGAVGRDALVKRHVRRGRLGVLGVAGIGTGLIRAGAVALLPGAGVRLGRSYC